MLRRSAWVVGALAFLITLIVIAPAALIPQFLDVPHLRIERTQGTLWRGSVETSLNTQQVGTLTWRVRPVELIKGSLTVDLTLEREELALTGASVSGFNGHEVFLSGTIGSRLLNVYIVDYDMRLSGVLAVDDVKLRLNNENLVEAVTGELTWNGGPVRFKLANVMHEVILEPVHGTLSLDEDFIQMNVRRQRSGEPVLLFRFDPASGWLHLRALPAFLEFANVPSNYLMQDADFLFEVSQKIF
ncbi:MAG: type II secretion system protein N [Gammaproteobacteria bacterium]|nr:type II secretion system protein N [Gammaproteobacteria bacterium]